MTPGPDRIVIKVLCDDLSPVVTSLMWWESFRRWITWCIFNFPAVAPVQDSVGQMEMSAGQAGDISRRGLQHLRHDVRRSLPEAGQEGVRVILATKEKQQRRQKVSGQFRKCHISSDLLRERTQGPWWVNGPSRQQGIITHPHLCSLFLYSIRQQHLACSLPQSCITNNGLTYVPLINTSADKLASHTSILVWGRLISGADTGLSICVTCTLRIGMVQLQHSWSSRLITKRLTVFYFSKFDWKLDLCLLSGVVKWLFFVYVLLGGAQSNRPAILGPRCCVLVSQYLGYQREQTD